tara:strand:+ start:455 stop:1216 length:762 start_codon:yes stop_codon:yes gene_type:complete
VSAADRLEDGFPHGTRDGYERGCKGVCPAGEEFGLSCRKAKSLAAGDYQYQKLARRGAGPAEIADALGLMPEIAAIAKQRPKRLEEEPPEEETMTATAKPTKAKAAPKQTGPTQREVRTWAREQGLEVNERGSLPKALNEAYVAAHATTPPTVVQDDETPVPAEAVNAEEPLAEAEPVWESVEDLADTPLPEEVVLVSRVEEERSSLVRALEIVMRQWESARRRIDQLEEELRSAAAENKALRDRPWWKRRAS